MPMDPLYVLLGEVSIQIFCPFSNQVVFLPGIELCELCIYFIDQTLIQCTLGKYVLPYGWFPCHCDDGFFSSAEAMDLSKEK